MILLLLASACTPDAVDAPNARVHTVIDDTGDADTAIGDSSSDDSGSDDSGDTAIEDAGDTGSADTADTADTALEDTALEDTADTALEDTAVEPCTGIVATLVSCTGSCAVASGGLNVTTSSSGYEASTATFAVTGCTTGAYGRSFTQETSYGWLDLSWPGDSNPSTTAGRSPDAIRDDPTADALLDDYGNPVDGWVDTEVTLTILTHATPELGGASAEIFTDHGWVTNTFSVNWH